jgi:hypothetical protein
VTRTEVAIGVIYTAGANEQQAALGGGAYKTGDVQSTVRTIVDDINRRGGAAGRKLRVVFHEQQAADATPKDAKMQAACSAFTEDQHVLVAIANTTRSDTFNACMQKAGAVIANGVGLGFTDRDLQRAAAYYDVQLLATDHVVTNLVDALVAQRYFTPWDTTSGRPGSAPVRVGILAPDTADWAQVVPRVIVAELARHGIPVERDNVYVWHFPDSTAGNGQAASQIQSAVLRFRSNGVTHVLPMEVNSSTFFASAAESQGYRPRYGVNSLAQFQVFGGTLIPRGQLGGAVGLGWLPSLDLPASANADDGPYAGAGRRRCLHTLKQAGITPSDGTAKSIALVLCDELYSVQAALDAIGPADAVNAGSYLRGLASLGNRFGFAGLPQGSFAGHRYPVRVGWRLRYDAECQCMRYDGRPISLR